MAVLFTLPKAAYVANSRTSGGAKLYFYLSGTTTEAAVYTDSALTTAHTQPVTAASSGVFAPIYLDETVVYKVQLKTASGSLVYEVDPINAILTAAEVGQALYPQTAAELAASVTPTSYTYPAGNVLRYGADPTGVSDSATAINNAILANEGVISLPAGTFKVASTIKLKGNRRLIGAGAGDYRQGAAIDRITSIRPVSTFNGTDIIRVDPADFGTDAYVTGVEVSDLTIDMYDVKDENKVALRLLSASNTETFRNIRVINQNDGNCVYIGASANSGALQADGIRFENLYTLSEAIDPSNTDPGVIIEEANEITLAWCKITRRSSGAMYAGSIGILVRSTSTYAVNDVYFDGTFVGGYETGIYAETVAGAAQGPRWVRSIGCSFETVKYCFRFKGTSSYPVQFCSVYSPRQQTTINGGRIVYAEEYTNSCFFLLDEYVGNVFGEGSAISAELAANTTGNIVWAQTANVTDSGTDNAVIGRAASGTAGLQINGVSLTRLQLAGAAISSGTGVLSIGNGTQTTVGSAGGATALPATPTGYIKCYLGSAQVVIPYYAQA